jgi:hypothetical protein
MNTQAYLRQKAYKLMYQYRKPEYIKVQCISTKFGLHKDLKLGQWYDAIEYGKIHYKIECNISYASQQYTDYNIYDKSLFRTIDQRRDNKLNKILC